MIGKIFETPRSKRLEIKGEWGGCWLMQVMDGYEPESYELVMTKFQMQELIKSGHYKEII